MPRNTDVRETLARVFSEIEAKDNRSSFQEYLQATFLSTKQLHLPSGLAWTGKGYK